MKAHFLVIAANVAALGASGLTKASDIIVPAGDAVPGLTAPGLNGAVYHDGLAQPLTGDPATELSALNVVIAAGPNSTFNALSLNFDANGTDLTPTNTFLGADSNGTAASDTTPLNTTIFDMTGVLSIPEAGTYTFTAQNSDDASYILIDGQTVVSVPGSHLALTDSGTATFAAPGNYPIEVLYANQDYKNSTGAASFQYASDFSAAGDPHMELGHVVPEPATIGLIALGSLGLVARRRRV